MRNGLAALALVIGLLWVVVGVSAQAGQPSTSRGEWPHYTADLKGTRFSPLDQINASNFNKLEVAWRFKTDNFGPFPEYKLEGTPLMIGGVLYTTAGTRRSVIALDGKTGELIWAHSYREGKRAAAAPRQLSGRGVAYWTDGKGDERVLYVTTGYRLIALNAKTGAMINSFGTGGVVDLKVGVVRGIGQQINLETGEIGVHSTPTVVRDMVIVGSSMREGATVPTHNNTKGLVRAFDVRTGKMVWRFSTIPGPGEFGNNTWEDDSWAYNGNVGVWNQITVDEELGLVYLPVETPSSDYYGGHRPGDNLFAESLVAVDLKTGQRKWHYQLVHHPLWNYDMPAAPILGDVVIDGKPRKVVAQLTKQAWAYVLDRVTGQPIWPIEERPVPQSDVPGEKSARTQPHVTKPPAYAREFLRVPDDLVDFTPDLRAKALEIIKRYKVADTPFNPPILGDVNGTLGAIVPATATNWPGGGYDPENGILFAPAGNTFGSRTLVAPPQGFSDIRYVSGIGGRPFVEVFGPGDCCAADAGRRTREELPQSPAAVKAPPVPGLAIDGIPVVKPPYGLLAAMDLNRGTLLWQAPHGDTPDNIRSHPLLKGANIPKTGQPGTSGVGLMVTRALVVMGDPQITTPPGRPRGAMLRAYDKKTGQEVGALLMPAIQSGSPMTYLVDGKQYIVVAVSGGNYSGEYLALALPDSELTR
ncbi:MAG: quinoprotein glucose dehydrogenase [Acidobacteria bacterium RIFCSPLOWO2_02_FULL_68_18]|nr:MAG: quinoprotein glucose dehydrogenase [Acidobacteria bacterium RIFCSPLOWO2_02_FULL_68_18]OFW50101.1 MAG: quinoprotein glucose dehydrogenase [Acidobacteria bacterium RIFCSPLOWO2_12_FULL_68_19]